MDKGEKRRSWGLVIVCGLSICAGWQIHERLIAPLGLQSAESHRAIAELKLRIEGAHKTLSEARTLKERASQSHEALRSRQSVTPEGSALFWFPNRIQQHFERSGLAGAVARVNTTMDEPQLPGYERTYWAVELPVGNSTRDIRKSCLAVADIESVDPSMRVLDAAVRIDADVPTGRVLVMNVAVLAPKVGAAR